MENIGGSQAFSVEVQLLVDDALKKSERFKKELESVASAAEAEGKKIDKVFSDLGTGNLRRDFESLNKLSKEAFGELSASSQQYVKAIQDDIRALSQLEQMQSKLNDKYEDGEVTLDSYISAQARLSVLHDQIADAIRSNEQALRSETATMNMAEGSMESMQTQVALLTTAYMKLSQAQREGAEGQAILKNLSEVQAQLQNATVAMNKYAGAAGRQFNGLNFSIQQIARELPSLAMGPQMFFMAISNNLPIFTDELARARKEYASLQATGQKGIPVWKQVVKSLFSWQTAMAAGITLLVMHGDEIAEWITQLFKGKEAIDSVAEAVESMNKAIDAESLAGEIVNFEKLARAYKDIGENAEAKKKFLVEYKDEIERTGIAITDIYDADNLFIDNADNFIEAVKKRSLALAGMELAKEQYQKAIQEQVDNANVYKKRDTAMQNQDYYADLYSQQQAYLDNHPEISDNPLYLRQLEATRSNYEYWSNQVDTYNNRLNDNIEARIKEFKDAGDAYLDAANQLEGEADKILEDAGIRTSGEGEAKAINAINQRQSQIEALMNKNASERIRLQVDLENQVEQARIDAMSDGYEKSEAQRRLDNKKELQALAQQKQEYIDAVVQGEKEVFEAQENARAQQDKNYVKRVFDPSTVKVDTTLFDELEKQVKAGQLKSIRDSLNEVLKEVETFEQARLRIQDEYAEKRKVLYEKDGKTLRDGVEQANIDALYELEKDDVFKAWSDRLVNYTAETLELMLAEALEQLSILEATEGADPQDIVRTKEAADALVSSLSRLNAAHETSAGEIKKSESRWTDLNEVLSGTSGIFEDLGDAIPGVAGEIISAVGRISSAAGTLTNSLAALGKVKEDIQDNQRLLDQENSKMLPDVERIEELQDSLKELKSESVAAGMSVASAVAGIAASVISKITEVINANEAANEAAAQAAWEYAEALEQIQIKARIDKYDTIFGKDAWGSMLENADIVKDMRDNISGLFSDAQEARRHVPGRVSGWTNEIASALSGVSSKYNVAVTSDLRSGWQKFWGSGKGNVHTFNLGDYIREDGSVMVEELQTMYEANAEGMEEADKRLVKRLIQDGQILQEAMDSIASYISSLFDDVSLDVADSMITAFEKTGNVANATFEDIRQSIARSFAQDAIVHLLSKNVFTQEAEEKMTDLIESGDSEGALDYLDTLLSRVESLAPTINDTLKGVYGEYANSAQDTADGQERTSASKGIAQASQDSIDELNGRATAIQSHTFSINENMKTLVSTSAMMLDRLVGIENNTSHLEMIDDNIAILSREMGNLRSDLTLRGIRLAR